VFNTLELRALDAASSTAAMLIREMIYTLADTNANAARVFVKMASLRIWHRLMLLSAQRKVILPLFSGHLDKRDKIVI